MARHKKKIILCYALIIVATLGFVRALYYTTDTNDYYFFGWMLLILAGCSVRVYRMERSEKENTNGKDADTKNL